MAATTPLRILGPTASVADPSPDAPAAASPIIDILASSDDLASWSDELATHVDDWDSRFHLSPQRANFLRGLPLGAPEAVLEVGAGAGALTRYLGEISGVVDALETHAELAAAARRRCADLPHVTVYELLLGAVPAEPTYDLIVAASIPAPSGSQVDPLTALLVACRGLLRPGGRLVVAVDNSQGIRHLAGGTPPRLPDGLAPLLSTRSELEQAGAAAGLGTQVLGAFPDHRHTTRLIDHQAIRAIDASLLERIVKLPSPAYDGDEADGVREVHLWSEAVSDRADQDHPNSFVLVAGDRPLAVDPLTYWSSGRRADLTACNRVRATTDGPVVVRAHAYPAAPALDGPLRLRPHTERYVTGTPLVDLLAATTSPDDAVPLLETWLELVTRAEADGRVPWDLIPRNVQVDASGTAHAIDQEWEHEASDQVSTLRRGMFWLAYDLLCVTSPPGWLSQHTVSSAADVLTALSGHDVPISWSDFLDAEAVSMASIAPRSAHDSLTARTRKERRNLSYLSRQPAQPADTGATRTVIDALTASNQELRLRVEQLEMARRHDAIVARDHAIGLRAKLEAALAELTRANDQLEKERGRIKKLRTELNSVRSSTSWRIGSTLVRPVARLTRRGQ